MKFGAFLLYGAMFALTAGAQMFQSVNPDQATLIMRGENREYCPNCGMNLVKFYKTNHTYNGKQYSSLHCLFEVTEGKMPTGVQVVDAKNLNFIDVLNAYYVVGSSVKGTMTRNSKYAFSNETDAKEFQAKNGGEIMNFAQAYEVAGKDFDGDKNMIKANREGGVYAKGKEIYESRCDKVDPKKFGTIADLKVALKSACKDTSDDSQLQATALYLWDAPKMTKPAKKVKFERIVVPKDARCPICGMFVAKNPQWASMIEDKDQNFYFDGVKDMMKYHLQNGKKFERLFVSDYYKLRKTDAKEAFYVIGSDVFGPMGDELIPFASEDEAMTFARDHAGKRILKFDEIDESVLKGL